jgi:hypothetical protein
MNDMNENTQDNIIVAHLRTELAKTEPSRRKRIIEKFVLPQDPTN